jgi:hypothetical protein
MQTCEMVNKSSKSNLCYIDSQNPFVSLAPLLWRLYEHIKVSFAFALLTFIFLLGEVL